MTTNLSWRWIFYINLPLGVLALFVLAVTFPSVAARTRHRIDYTGTALLALALAALVLMVSLGGTTYPWASTQVVGLGAISLIALGGFVVAERRAAEPVLPLKLLKNQVFVTAGIVAVLLGFAMFGTITFLPLYFQVVKGASPTGSGLDLLPLMAGLLITSIVGGQIVSRTGKYRAFPIVGTAIMTVGLFLLSRLSPETSTLEAAAFMFVTGFGIGLVMQVLVVAVQNAVDYRGTRSGHVGQHSVPQHRQLGRDGDHRHHLRHRAGQSAPGRLPARLGQPAQHIAPQRGQPRRNSLRRSTRPTSPPTPAPWTPPSRSLALSPSRPSSPRGSSRNSPCARP